MKQNSGSLIVSHPTGNANLRATLDGFAGKGILNAFYTSVACRKNSFFDLLSSLPGLGELNRRRFDPHLDNLIRSYPYVELMRLFALKSGIKSLIKHETGVFSIDAVYRSIDKKLASDLMKTKIESVRAVYAYEDGAYHTFKAAKTKNLSCFYDLPIGYWRSARLLMSEEIEKRPEWAATLSGFSDSETKTGLKDQELGMADQIFVASSFTALTLKDYPGHLNNINIIPYGFPPVSEAKKFDSGLKRPLKLLFVGGLSQRKGIADVIEAAAYFGNKVELEIIGRAPATDIPVLSRALDRYNWIPSLPHNEVLEHMHRADVLLFPSLFEGFGLVITEAMSQGTPVICTDRTAGPDLITHNENGWLVPAAEPLKLIETINMILEQPGLLEKNSEGARKKAAERPWSKYGSELADNVLDHIKNKTVEVIEKTI